MSAVSIRDLGIEIGSVRIIEKLSLEIAKGEFIVLLGPSGCGKSTLLNAIAGLSEVDPRARSGSAARNVTWIGAEGSRHRHGVPVLLRCIRACRVRGQSCAFGLQDGQGAEAGRDRAGGWATAAELLRLDASCSSRKPCELSGGQRQRVAIGRALVRRRRRVPVRRAAVQPRRASCAASCGSRSSGCTSGSGATMIYVTHDQIEALTLADRIAIMKAGVIQQLATPHDIYHHPANLFVAGFIGSPAMNMVEGSLARTEQGWTFMHTGGSVDLGRYPFRDEPAEKPAVLGVRPEHIGVGQDRPDRQLMSGPITIVEPMGAETILWTEWAGKPASIRVDGDTEAKVGDVVPLHFDVARANLFDATSGERI